MGGGREQPAVGTRSARPVRPGFPAEKGGGERPCRLLLPHPFLAGEEKPLGYRPRADASAQGSEGPVLGDDRGEGVPLHFPRAVREGSLRLAGRDPGRVVRIDAAATEEEVFRSGLRAVAERFGW